MGFETGAYLSGINREHERSREKRRGGGNGS